MLIRQENINTAFCSNIFTYAMITPQILIILESISRIYCIICVKLVILNTYCLTQHLMTSYFRKKKDKFQGLSFTSAEEGVDAFLCAFKYERLEKLFAEVRQYFPNKLKVTKKAPVKIVEM